MTLEWLPDDSAGLENSRGSTGWHYQHTCGNYEAVKAWAVDHRWKNATGII